MSTRSDQDYLLYIPHDQQRLQPCLCHDIWYQDMVYWIVCLYTDEDELSGSLLSLDTPTPSGPNTYPHILAEGSEG